jgi:hypothetical protein
VQDIVLLAEWWHAAEDCIRVTGPLLRVLRIADGDDLPAMPKNSALLRAIIKQERFFEEGCGDPGLPPGIPVMHTIHDPRRPS